MSNDKVKTTEEPKDTIKPAESHTLTETPRDRSIMQ